MSTDDFYFGNLTDFLNFNITDEPLTEKYAGVAIYGAFSFAGIFANIIMLVLIHKKKRRKSTFDLTIGSLAFADLVTSLFFLTNTSLYGVTLIDTAYWTDPITKAFNVLSNGSMYCIIASILHILSITIERLFGISYPFIYRQQVTKFRVKILICILWILSAGITVLDYVIWKDAMKGNVLATIIFSTGGLLCLMYGIIAYKAYLRKKQELAASRKEARVIQNSLAVTLCFICCTFPVAFADLGFDRNFSDKYGYLCSSFVAVKLLLDPLLYFFVSFYRERKSRKKSYWLGTTITSAGNVAGKKGQDGVSKGAVKTGASEKKIESDVELGVLNESNENSSVQNETSESESKPQQFTHKNGIINNGYCEEQSLSSDKTKENNNNDNPIEIEVVNEEEAAVTSDDSTESTDLSKIEIDELKKVEFEIDSYFSHVNDCFEDLKEDFESDSKNSHP